MRALENNTSVLLILSAEMMKMYWHNIFYKLQKNNITWIYLGDKTYTLSKDKATIYHFMDDLMLVYRIVFKDAFYHNYTDINFPVIAGVLFVDGKPVAESLDICTFARVKCISIGKLVNLAIEYAREKNG